MHKEQWEMSKQRDTRVGCLPLWRNPSSVEAVGGLCVHQVASGCYQNSPHSPSLCLITNVSITQLCI